MKMNKKLFIGITIVIYSIFGFAENAGSPNFKETIKTTHISETAD
ncbi:hypothetical protein ACFW35_13660 [Fictibacillus sp. NPDC058756]|jgi:hypothetical protein